MHANRLSVLCVCVCLRVFCGGAGVETARGGREGGERLPEFLTVGIVEVESLRGLRDER
jgi:hypothetical protein